MPFYVKFFNNILSNKSKLEEYKNASLMKECGALTQNNLPSKLKDLDNFFIPCVIGKVSFH